MRDPRGLRPLVVCVLIGLGVRVAYVLAFRRHGPLVGDAYFYHHAANLLADGHGWIVPYDYFQLGQVNQAADHPPLYIAYLAAWSLLGVDTITGHLLATALLGTGGVALVGLVGRRVGGPWVGATAAGLAAIYPNLWGWDGMGLSEPTGVVGVCLVILAGLRCRADPTLRHAALLGLAVGIAGLGRAELLLLGPALALPFLWRPAAGSVAARLRVVGVAGAVAAATVAPWVAYNLSRFEEPVYLSSGFDITMAYSNCDTVFDGELTGYWDFACAVESLEDSGIDPDALDQSQRSAVWRSHNREFIGDNLDRLPYVVLARIGRVAGLYQPLQQARLDVTPEGRELWTARGGAAGYYLLAISSIAGWVHLGRRRADRYPLLPPLVIVLLSAAMTFGATRYRASAEPVLCVLAAVAFVALWDGWRRVRDEPGAPPRAPLVETDPSGPGHPTR